MKKVIHIEGMSCKHCQMQVESALSSVPGVRKAIVDLKNGTAQVDVSEMVADNVLKKAVADAGYSVTKIGD
jgi:copper chaperone CopZ